MKILDTVEQVKDTQPVMTFHEMMDMATRCGLPSSGFALEEEVTYVLQYLTQLGNIKWHESPRLRDLVIIVRRSDASLLPCPLLRPPVLCRTQAG